MGATTVTGTILGVDNAPLVGVYVTFRLKSTGTDAVATSTINATQISAITDASGQFSTTLWDNGDSGVTSILEIRMPSGQRHDVIIPAADAAIDIWDLIENYTVGTADPQSSTALSLKADRDAGNLSVANESEWRTKLGLVVGTNVQAYDAQLTDIAALTPTNESIIKGDGTNFVTATNFRVDAGTLGTGTEMGTGVADGDYAVAEGAGTTASGFASHAEGISTIASGIHSHAEGFSSTASGSAAHAEGRSSTASGDYSHAEGDGSTASGDYSSATGRRGMAIHDGARVEADSQNADVSSTTTDQFTARFQNGYEFKGGLATFEGGISGSIVSSTTSVITTTYTALATDVVLLVDDDTAGAAVTITLISAVTAGDGFTLTIKKLGSTGDVIIDASGTETIDDSLTNTIKLHHDWRKLVSDGANWKVIG